ncbi:MAG: CHAD domain-containing protein [Acidobacteriota bacterium]
MQGERVKQGIRRIAAEELDFGILNLRKEDEAVRDAGIHEARKCIKKLRGVVRLLMPGLGEGGKRANIALRNTGRSLSKLRDAAALIETVEALSERYFSDPAMEQLAVVRSALRRRMENTVRGEDCRTITGGAVAALKDVKRRMHRWQTGEGEFSIIGPGLERTYRRGREALRQAAANPTAENLHVLRRRVKDHWYHVRLLDGAWHGLSEQREKTLGELQEWLGDDHNLTVLREAIAADPGGFGGKRIVTAVLELITKAQKDLREPALRVAAKLYSEKPKALVLKVQEAWEAGRGESGIPKPPSATVAKRRTSAA